MSDELHGYRLDDVEARVVGLEAHLDELGAIIQGTVNELSRATGGTATRFDLLELDQWIREWLLPTFRRLPDGRGSHWCSRWWAHPEAVFRLAALHAAWKQLCGEGGAGPSIWLRDHLDPGLCELMGEVGPFVACKANLARHDPVDPLPVEELPSELVEELGGTAAAGLRPNLRLV